MFSNVVTTVSPTYAQEVLKPEVRAGGPYSSFFRMNARNAIN